VARRKRRVWRHSDELHANAVERVLNGQPVAMVAEELDLHARLLRAWVADARKGAGAGKGRPDSPRPAVALPTPEERLRRENELLKQALADRTLEVDFFRGALQKVEARRQPQGEAGGMASTTKSGK